MVEATTSLYEGLFLLSQQAVAADLGGVVDHLRQILDRADAQVVAMKKWADRRLAYEIKGQKRGVFILVYFTAPPDQIAHIERDCRLSEKIVRDLIIRADHMGQTEIEVIQKDGDLSLEAKLRSDLSTSVPAAEGQIATAADA